MNISRRTFLLGAAGAGAVAAAGTVAYFLPPAGGWIGKRNWVWSRADESWYPNWASPENQLSEELTYIVRRSFIPKMVTQLYDTSPLMAQLMKHPRKGPPIFTDDGLAWLAKQPRIVPQWTDESGSFTLGFDTQPYTGRS